MIEHVTSPDGARIGFERVGEGPPLLLVHGGTADRTRWLPVRDLLAEHFTVHVVDRRGRGLSTDEPASYAIEREGEDLVAVARAVGDGLVVVAHSYGATCALEALPSGAFARALLYEPAFATGDAPILPPAAARRMEQHLAAGEAEDALVVFFTDVIAAPPAVLEGARAMPDWPSRVDVLERTFGREGAAVEAYALRPERFAELATPVRLLLGTATAPGLAAATRAAHAAIPGSDLVELPGQGHVAMQTDPTGFVEHVRRFATE